MTRLHDLDDVMFDVETRPLFAWDGDRRMPVPQSEAIVALPSGRVVSVVGRGYRLVSHAEALELARRCARAAFPETNPGEWQVARVDAPSTGGTCFIDLAHNSAALDFSGVAAKDKPDVYGPFVRVTNSYNRTRALNFDIGYCRKVCQNGLILRSTLITFKLNHRRSEIRDALRFDISPDRLARQRQDFQAFLRRLQACAVPPSAMAGLACAVLGLRAPEGVDTTEARLNAWESLSALIASASGRYEQELGANAYAVLNTVTEFASRPPVNLLVRRDRHSLQRRAGEWAADFASTCADGQFDLGRYLETLEVQAATSPAARAATTRREERADAGD